MGFFYKRERNNIFEATAYKIKLLFASEDKRQKFKNDRRATSQSYANKRLKRRQKEMRKNFVRDKKSRHRKRIYKSRNKEYDSNQKKKK